MCNKNLQFLKRMSVLFRSCFHKMALLSGLVLLAGVSTNAQTTILSTSGKLSEDISPGYQETESTFYLRKNFNKYDNLFLNARIQMPQFLPWLGKGRKKLQEEIKGSSIQTDVLNY